MMISANGIGAFSERDDGMSRVVVFGTGQIAEVADFYLEKDSEHEVVAFTVDKEYIKESVFLGLPVIPFEDVDSIFPPDGYRMFIPISYKSMNRARERKYLEAKKKGYSFISYISSKAVYYGTAVGENCFILENNVLQPFSKVGNNVVMWSGNHLGHHSVVGDNCFVTSQAVISGNVSIGNNSFVGVNATIRDNLEIGRYSLIGAGAVILGNTSDYDVYTAKGSTVKLPKRSIDILHI